MVGSSTAIQKPRALVYNKHWVSNTHTHTLCIHSFTQHAGTHLSSLAWFSSEQCSFSADDDEIRRLCRYDLRFSRARQVSPFLLSLLSFSFLSSFQLDFRLAHYFNMAVFRFLKIASTSSPALRRCERANKCLLLLTTDLILLQSPTNQLLKFVSLTRFCFRET